MADEWPQSSSERYDGSLCIFRTLPIRAIIRGVSGTEPGRYRGPAHALAPRRGAPSRSPPPAGAGGEPLGPRSDPTPAGGDRAEVAPMTCTVFRPPHPTSACGLTGAEVRDRVERGQRNVRPSGPARTLGQILRANLLTPFNVLLGTLAVAVVLTGSWRDALFGLVIVANSFVGIVQEVRAKRALDRLEVLNSPIAHAVRDGEVSEIPSEAVVVDDLLEIGAGDQIVADGLLVSVEGLEVDESLLTGEADAVLKRPGDPVLSGTIVTAGWGRCQVTAVGASSFASRLTSEARRFTTTSSELMNGINRILACVAVAVVVAGPVLFVTQRRSADTWQEALHASVAGLVGIVPEGLVLLTSAAFFAAALGLARHRVLVRDLPAVEGLARIDVLCVDKTGTLTGGEITFDHFEVLGTAAGAEVEAAIGALAAQDHPNATVLALRHAFPSSSGWIRSGSVPFSSTRRWSAASFMDCGTWVLGAPDVVAAPGVGARALELTANGQRTLLLARTAAPNRGQRAAACPRTGGGARLRGDAPRRRGRHHGLLQEPRRRGQGHVGR